MYLRLRNRHPCMKIEPHVQRRALGCRVVTLMWTRFRKAVMDVLTSKENTLPDVVLAETQRQSPTGGGYASTETLAMGLAIHVSSTSSHNPVYQHNKRRYCRYPFRPLQNPHVEVSISLLKIFFAALRPEKIYFLLV